MLGSPGCTRICWGGGEHGCLCQPVSPRDQVQGRSVTGITTRSEIRVLKCCGRELTHQFTRVEHDALRRLIL
ncbi:hypothetical protein ALP04_200101 [Pseudomonas amygdali pv. sesami]|nr:hypothetical protein ALP04_200101 [Pseudomonas amygdali pv. sesami]